MVPATVQGVARMAYKLFSLLVVAGDFSRWMDVAAISIEAAEADVRQAYGDVRIAQWSVR